MESVFKSVQKFTGRVNKQESIAQLSHFLAERDYSSGSEWQEDECSVLSQSMIGLMKNRKADVVETVPADTSMSGFEALFMEHWARVYRLLYRLVGDPAEAEDLALETFLRLYRRYPPRESGFNFPGWLHRVATNLGLQSIRSWKRRERYEVAAGKYALEEAHEEQPAQLVAEEEERRLVRLALSKMNEKQSQLLILRHSGLSYREIAEALRLARTSIGPLLVRAEREFAKHYRSLAKEE